MIVINIVLKIYELYYPIYCILVMLLEKNSIRVNKLK